MNLFHRHQEKPAEEIKPIPEPATPAETKVKEDPIKPIRINDENYVFLLKALRPIEKIERVLKDLAVDPSRAKAVMAGSSNQAPSDSFSHESPGPIV